MEIFVILGLEVSADSSFDDVMFYVGFGVADSTRSVLGKCVYLVTLAMSLLDLQDVCIAIGSITTLDLPMVVDLIGIYGLKGPYCTLTTTNWFLQALSVIPRGSWGDVARRFTMIRWAAGDAKVSTVGGPEVDTDTRTGDAYIAEGPEGHERITADQEEQTIGTNSNVEGYEENMEYETQNYQGSQDESSFTTAQDEQEMFTSGCQLTESRRSKVVASVRRLLYPIEIREINWVTYFLPKIDPASKGKETLVVLAKPTPVEEHCQLVLNSAWDDVSTRKDTFDEWVHFCKEVRIKDVSSLEHYAQIEEQLLSELFERQSIIMYKLYEMEMQKRTTSTQSAQPQTLALEFSTQDAQEQAEKSESAQQEKKSLKILDAPGSDQIHKESGTSTVGGGRSPNPVHDWKQDSFFPCCNREASTCVTLNGSGIQLAVGPQPLWLRNHNFGLTHRIMVKRLATSSHDPIGITDSAYKNQLVMVSVQYGPFNTYIPIRSTTIGTSRVARDLITMHTSRRSNSDIACVTRVSMTFQVVRTNQYNQDLGLIHSTNGNHLESPNEGSSIDHQVTIHLHAQSITMFPTNETWYFTSQMLVSSSGGLILILTAQSTRNEFRIHNIAFSARLSEEVTRVSQHFGVLTIGFSSCAFVEELVARDVDRYDDSNAIVGVVTTGFECLPPSCDGLTGPDDHGPMISTG
ncbi:F-box protein [Dorcoceras hygrometricum]|uniref:F-box protein n=1 Tax=Dorcoceras hygrometricum TaxID=472368 RepID=A0A2Z7CD52_9LAMI|nr:F-box protein [Dorcoceras hygrometricum]